MDEEPGESRQKPPAHPPRRQKVHRLGMVLFIMMNSAIFSQLLSFSGASAGLLGWATGFDVAPLVLLLILIGVLLVMGMFMDPVSMMLIPCRSSIR